MIKDVQQITSTSCRGEAANDFAPTLHDSPVRLYLIPLFCWGSDGSLFDHAFS